MPTLYRHLIGQIGNALAAIAGGQVAAAETAYAARTWNSARWPSSLVVDKLADAVGTFAEVIAETAEHPFRRYLADVTANIAHEAQIPNTGSGTSKPIIGIYGAVRDATSFDPLDVKPLEYVRRCVRLRASGVLVNPVYHYNRVGTYLYHTRDNVKIEVCVFDRDAERALILAEVTPGPGAGNACILPDTLDSALVAEALANLVQVDEFIAQASYYKSMADAAKAQIRAGLASVSSDIPGNEGQ